MDMKPISNSFLYKSLNDYGKVLVDFVLTGERIDKSSQGFDDIIFDVKRQVSSIVLKVLLSDKVVLLFNDKGVSRAFKVFRMKDLKSPDKSKKVFIDCTGLIKFNNGVYKCTSLKTLIAYLTTAMVYILYYDRPNAIISNITLTKNGASAFTDMMLHILSYIKVPITYADNKERMSFVIAEYYMYCVLGIPYSSDTPFNVAKTISKIENKDTCKYLHTLFSFIFSDNNCDIDKFIKKFAEVFLNQKDDDINTKSSKSRLSLDGFSQRWMYAFGAGTFLGLECFVPFSQILTDCYSGAYINQQNTIEKIVGAKIITNFVNELIKVGSDY